MTVTPLEIPDVLLFDCRVFGDSRGYFFESFRNDLFMPYLQTEFVQENESFSTKGVVRGLHFQRGDKAQGKLIRVISGEILDVAVDLRKGSPTYGRHVRIPLTSDKKRWAWIPRGFAHGFAVLSETATFCYKCDNYYAPEAEGGVLWNDPRIGIDWGVAEPLVSAKDAKNPALAELSDPGFRYSPR